jgi:hypothetical protein
MVYVPGVRVMGSVATPLALRVAEWLLPLTVKITEPLGVMTPPKLGTTLAVMTASP